MENKVYYKAKDVQKEIDNLWENGIQRGVYMGYEPMYDYYSIKLGSTTYLMGAPFVGKSEWWLEVLINLSRFYGWRHVIFTPETGSVAEIVAELASKYWRKPFYKNYDGQMTANERYEAENFINEYFVIVEPGDSEVNIDQYLKMVDEIEVVYGIEIQTTMMDPFNELQHDLSGDNSRQDLYIEKKLGLVRRNAKAKNRHHCIITHCKDQSPITEKGVTYYPPPTARDYAGGQAWYRKGLGMICVWRPPFGLCDKNGIPFEENETHLIIQKYKPKGMGKKGTVKLYYDVQTNGYYTPDPVYGHAMKKYAKKLGE